MHGQQNIKEVGVFYNCAFLGFTQRMAVQILTDVFGQVCCPETSLKQPLLKRR